MPYKGSYWSLCITCILSTFNKDDDDNMLMAAPMKPVMGTSCKKVVKLTYFFN